MNATSSSPRAPYLAILGALVLVAVWGAVAAAGVFPESLFPTPLAVARALVQELRSGRLVDDALASVPTYSIGSATPFVPCTHVQTEDLRGSLRLLTQALKFSDYHAKRERFAREGQVRQWL